MKKFKPTADECKTIRECAMRSADAKRVIVRPGSRYNLHDRSPKPDTYNLTLISNMPFPEWEDTDLNDNCRTFADWKSGDLLDAEGRGIFDFYVYIPRGFPGRDDYDEELETNVTAYYADGKLAWVEGTGNGKMWTREVA